MTESASVGIAITPEHFLKKVPATSVSPTYKLTLPSEVVSATLSHLVDRDFKLVASGRERTWDVSIVPRRNKDKFEYTLQGWRAFAEDQGVRTGDTLEFVLLSDDKLQVDITRRAPPVAQVLAALQHSDSNPLRLSSTSSSDEHKLGRQAGSFHGPQSSGQLPSRQTGDDPAALSSLSDEVILELGHYPRDKNLSPQVPNRRQAAQEDTAAPEPHSHFLGHGQWGKVPLGFRRSSEPDALAFRSLEKQFFRSRGESGDGLQGMSTKRQRLCSLTGAAASLAAALDPFEQQFQQRRLLMASRSTSFPGSQDVFMVGRGRLPEAPATGMQALHSEHAVLAGVELSEAAPVSLEGRVAELRQALSGALLRAERAEHEVADLVAALRSAAGAVEEGVAQSLTLAGALAQVADRLGAAELAHLLEPRAARQLGLLQGQLRHYLSGLLDVLWQIRRLPQLAEHLD